MNLPRFPRYFLIARLMPGIISAVPFFLLYFSFLRSRLGSFFDAFLKAQWLGDVSTAAAFLFLWVMIGRTIAKDVFERRWFRSDETRMPTTDFLLRSNGEYSAGFKDRLRGRLHQDFGVFLATADEEAANEEAARKRIAEAVGLMRRKVGEGHLLLQHNIEYGFFRNLLGGSVAAVVVCAANLLIFRYVSADPQAFATSIVLAAVYIVPIVLGKTLVRAYGKRYARVLFQEYLAG